MYIKDFSRLQKERFLDLCIIAAHSDDAYETDEKEFILDICKQMGDVEYREIAEKPMMDGMDELIANSSPTELRMFAVELMKLLLVDERYEEREREFAELFFKKAGFSDEMKKTLIALVQEMHDAEMELVRFVVM